MGNGVPFDEVWERVQSGSDSAAELVVRETFERLVRLIRGKISRRYAGKVDASDIANSALENILRRPYPLTDWRGLWNLLVEVAVCKLSNRIRACNRQCRDVNQTQRMDDAENSRAQPVRKSESPDERVMVDDLIDHLLDNFSEVEQKMIGMTLEGYSVQEIKAATGFCERTVIRVRKRFQMMLEAVRDADAR